MVRMDAPFPLDPNEFADTPLFREMQRVLASSSGPVNWELARQVGIAAAQDGRPDPAATDDDQRSFEEAARVAELQVARITGLEPPGDVAPVAAIRRAEWVTASVEGLRDSIEPAAAKAGAAFGDLAGAAVPADAAAGIQLLGQLSPLLLGAQVGAVLGELGARALGRYDIPVPHAGPEHLDFVAVSVSGFERDWSLDPTEFRVFVAFHEVTLRFAFARPWTRARFGELLQDFFSTLTIDVEGMRVALERLDASNPESIQELMSGDPGLFGTVLDDEQRLKLGRIQAFLATASGYADHVTKTLAAELLPSHARIEEAMLRHREDASSDAVFERLLGVEVEPDRYSSARTFCETVAELADQATLARIWEGADALPSLPELDEPRLWLARTV